MILHVIPTVTTDFARDYVMLVPAERSEDVAYILATEPADPAVIERDILFAGMSAFLRIYDDVVVHTRPL